MIELPDFTPLKVTQRLHEPTAAVLDAFDHVAVLASAVGTAAALRKLPHAAALERLLARAKRNESKTVTAHLQNARATGLTLALATPGSAFNDLGFARRVVAESLRDRPRNLGVVAIGLHPTQAETALQNLIAAADAAALELPTFKSEPRKRAARLQAVTLFAPGQRVTLAATRARALGNNVARWLTALPPNRLSPAQYRKAIDELVAPYPIETAFLGERELQRLNAGAFLAVAQGNATRDAGIVRLRYRPSGAARTGVALVGKGVLFDTGGTNLKPFHGMLDMHTDMQGSAVALGALLALAELRVPFAVDAWLALTENRSSATAYKSQDVVHAANGTSIQVIHTDAEGRMVLADTLALAARERPQLIIDYATLTGSCRVALTDRYSGAFSNRAAANQLLIAAGAACGERVWPFPMDDDFDEALKSDVADVKQCAVESEGDHILAARFLRRFVPDDIPWIHLDLAASKHKGGLAHVPTDITGFGVGLTLELLRGQAQGPEDLAKKLAA
jgi:leucyl aminopeptidase